MKWIVALCLCLLASPCWGSSAARDLLHDGLYSEARETALATQTVDGLNIAAEAMAAEIMLMRVDDAKDHAKDAIKLTETALARDPDNIEARFLRALHTGFRTRSSSAFAILMKGLIGDTRDAIDEFATIAPDDARADALRGAWHLGIVRAAGEGRFDASLEAGMAHYDRAVAAFPDDIVIMGNYAFSLIVMDDPALLPRAAELLDQIEAEAPDNATERDTRSRMLRLRAVIDDPDQLKERATALLNTEEPARDNKTAQ
jgi:cytochrome c-type biogenesis protein CcmH/NrfG